VGVSGGPLRLEQLESLSAERRQAFQGLAFKVKIPPMFWRSGQGTGYVFRGQVRGKRAQQLKAQGPSRTCNESKEEEEEKRAQLERLSADRRQAFQDLAFKVRERPCTLRRDSCVTPRPESGLDCLICAIFARQGWYFIFFFFTLKPRVD